MIWELAGGIEKDSLHSTSMHSSRERAEGMSSTVFCGRVDMSSNTVTWLNKMIKWKIISEYQADANVR